MTVLPSTTANTPGADAAPRLTDYAVAPGEYLAEWIDEQAVSQPHVAELLGYSHTQLIGLLSGRVPVTEEIATRLERVTGLPTAAWLRYEAAYRADLARIAS